jgi:hypothetical protein
MFYKVDACHMVVSTFDLDLALGAEAQATAMSEPS